MFDEYYDAKLNKKEHPELRHIKRIVRGVEGCKHIHIIGICGTAMGTFALMLRDSGFMVTGSDISAWPPMGPLLKSSGIEIFEGWDASHISGSVDLVVVGNACAPDHVEVIAALENKKPLMSMPEIMGAYYVGEEKDALVVAGTHGKTTTSGLLAHMLTKLNLDPTYLIGGVMQTKESIVGTSHRVGAGKYVVFEGDEYDTSFFDARPKFLHYRPAYSIITSVEWDHVDIYENIEEYKTAFKHLIHLTKKGLVVSDTYPLLTELIKETPTNAEVIVYGMSNQASLKPVLKEIAPDGQHFDLDGESYVVPMYGTYNTLNATAVLGMLRQIGVDIKSEEVKNALASFPGMKRRQEIVKETPDGITIIDDFAHHPTAVRETVQGIRNRFPGRRIVALFEPRSNTSRRKLFEKTYPEALAIADLIGIKVPPYKPEMDAGKDLLDPEVVKRDIEKLGKKVFLSETAQELVDTMKDSFKSDDVIVVMSNGSFDGIHDILARTVDKNVKIG